MDIIAIKHVSNSETGGEQSSLPVNRPRSNARHLLNHSVKSPLVICLPAVKQPLPVVRHTSCVMLLTVVVRILLIKQNLTTYST